MLVNVDNLVIGDSKAVSFSDTVEIPKVYSKETKVLIELTGDITNTGKEYYFNGKVNADFTTNCNLCLKPISIKLSFDMSEVFRKDIGEDNEDCWSFTDKTIDLKPAVVSNILLNIPMRAVCSDDCKGLCPICGQNLNEGSCDCDTFVVDPRFEKLRTLFSDKEV